MTKPPSLNNKEAGSQDPLSGCSELEGMDKGIWARLNRDHEDELKKWALHLHDRVATPLSDVKLRLNLAWEAGGDDRARQSREEINSAIDLILGEVRQVIEEHRPPLLDDLGLSDTLQWYTRVLTRLHGITIHLSLQPSATDPPEPYCTEVFRLFQMFCRDLGLEVQADTLHIGINYGPSRISLDYRDNGLDISSLGECAWEMLELIKIRLKVEGLGGELSLRQAPVKGNSIRVTIPLPEKAAGSVSGGQG